jgi:hypothetical protein
LWAATTPSNMWCTVGLFVQVRWRLSLILKMAALIQFESTLKWHKNFKKRGEEAALREACRVIIPQSSIGTGAWGHTYIYTMTRNAKKI